MCNFQTVLFIVKTKKFSVLEVVKSICVHCDIVHMDFCTDDECSVMSISDDDSEDEEMSVCEEMVNTCFYVTPYYPAAETNFISTENLQT